MLGIGGLAAPAYAFGVTYVLLRAIGLVMPLRADEREEALGMDVTYHGEEAYASGEGAILVTPEAASRASGRSPTPLATGGSIHVVDEVTIETDAGPARAYLHRPTDPSAR